MQHDAIHPFATAFAMAQKQFCVCADLLQQQPVEVGAVLAHADRLHGFLPHLQRHLLLQRPARCGGRPSASEEAETPHRLRSRIRQERLCDDDCLHHRGFCSAAILAERQPALSLSDPCDLLVDEYRLLSVAEAVSHPRRNDYRHRIRDARAYRWSDDRHLDIPLARADDLPRDTVPRLHQTQRRLSSLRTDWPETSRLDHGLQQDFHQRGNCHHRFCDTGLLYYVHDVRGGHYPYGHSLRLSDKRLGVGRHAALSAEHDSLRP